MSGDMIERMARAIYGSVDSLTMHQAKHAALKAIEAIGSETEGCPTCKRISELLACSVGGGSHYAVEPKPSSVEVRFAKRDEAGQMSEILTNLHPVDDEGCFVFKRPLSTLSGESE